jgi:hypothetical protein
VSLHFQGFGVTREQSANWQKLGAIPQGEFDAAMAASDKPSTNGIILSTSRKS